MNSIFSLTSSRFNNLSHLVINSHKIKDEDILNFNINISNVFKVINKSEDDSNFLTSQLWILKTIINSTLVYFHDQALNLNLRSLEIIKLLNQRIVDPELINNFSISINKLINKKTNSKFSTLLEILNKIEDKSDRIGLISRCLYGYDPACFDLVRGNFKNYGFNFENINTKIHLENNIFKKIFIISTPNKSSYDLIQSSFYMGSSDNIELVLYDHENFHIPARIELPIQPELSSVIKKLNFKLVNKNLSLNDEYKDELKLNSIIEEKFWTEIHGGSRDKTIQSVPSHYILFENGEGAFMPVEGKILNVVSKVLISNEDSFDYELLYKNILKMKEGDYVLFRTNSSGFLINEPFAGNGNDDDDASQVLDKITDWKSALEALLITLSSAEIANLLCLKGVNVSASKIKHWNGIEVIAPNLELEFKALIEVLYEAGKLDIHNLKNYIDSTWKNIVEYRISRQKAGSKVRSNILDNLLLEIKGIDLFSLASHQKLDLDMGDNILIRRIATIDQSISYIQNSNLYKINELRNFRWLK